MIKEDKLLFDFEINNTKYEVFITDKIENKDDETIIGETNYEKQTIHIKRGKPSVMLRTFRHEIVHVWLYEYGHYQHEKEFSNEDVCEIVACSYDYVSKLVDRWDKSIKFN